MRSAAWCIGAAMSGVRMTMVNGAEACHLTVMPACLKISATWTRAALSSSAGISERSCTFSVRATSCAHAGRTKALTVAITAIPIAASRAVFAISPSLLRKAGNAGENWRRIHAIPLNQHGRDGTTPAPRITQLLLAWGDGDQAAFEQLAPLVYDELRRAA